MPGPPLRFAKCENLKKLHKPDSADNDLNDYNWYAYLLDKLLDDCDFNQIHKNKLSIISYNYDRSLETALFNAIIDSYESAENIEDCKSELKGIPIVHMYGRLDPLPWESENGRAYGDLCSSCKFHEMSKDIKLIQEAEQENIPTHANKLIKDAERVYFLGLDLTRQDNLELLDLHNLEGKAIVGTAVGLENSEKNQITKFINNYSKNDIGNNKNPTYIESFKTLRMIRYYMALE